MKYIEVAELLELSFANVVTQSDSTVTCRIELYSCTFLFVCVVFLVCCRVPPFDFRVLEQPIVLCGHEWGFIRQSHP